ELRKAIRREIDILEQSEHVFTAKLLPTFCLTKGLILNARKPFPFPHLVGQLHRSKVKDWLSPLPNIAQIPSAESDHIRIQSPNETFSYRDLTKKGFWHNDVVKAKKLEKQHQGLTSNTLFCLSTKRSDCAHRTCIAIKASGPLENGKTIKIKICGDGTNIGKRLSVVNITYTILNENKLAMSEKGNYLLAVTRAKESYETLAESLKDLIKEMELLTEITLDNITYPLEYFLGGDWKFLASDMCVIGGANADYACIWCLCPKLKRQLKGKISTHGQ
ncbi:Hypothetical predicted protein, partial [Paramuricea clavata]